MPRKHPPHHACEFALARLITRLAGMLYRRQRDEWWADVMYTQKIKHKNGLSEAASCLASAPGFALHDMAKIRRHPAAAPWVTTYYLGSVILSRLVLLAVVAVGQLAFTWLVLHVPGWLGLDQSAEVRYVERIISIMSFVFDIAVLGTAVVTATFDIVDTYVDRRHERMTDKKDRP